MIEFNNSRFFLKGFLLKMNMHQTRTESLSPTNNTATFGFTTWKPMKPQKTHSNAS
jgi:hypothetical protein